MKKLLLLTLLSFLFILLPFVSFALELEDLAKCNEWCTDTACDLYTCKTVAIQTNFQAGCVDYCNSYICLNSTLPGTIPDSDVSGFHATVETILPHCQWTTAAQCEAYCESTICAEAYKGEDETERANCIETCDQQFCDGDSWTTFEVGEISNWVNTYRNSTPGASGTGGTGGTGTSTITTTTYETEELVNPIGATSVIEIVGNVTQALLAMLGAASLIVFIYGGVTMMTAAGNEDRVKKAKTTLIWAVLGIAIILASYSILEFVFDIFTPN